MFFLSCVCYAFVRICLFVPFWSPAGKRPTSWLSFVVYNCEFVTFSLVSWVRCGVSIPDLCTLTYLGYQQCMILQ